MKKYINKISLLLVFCLLLSTVGCGKKDTVRSYDIHTEGQAAYLNDSYANFKEYANGTEERSLPEPVVLEQLPSSIIIGMNSDLSDGKIAETVNGKLELYNLILGGDYYYRDSSDASAEIQHFCLEANAPRNLMVEGVTNIRDLGGWKTGDGKKVKQGLVYRSSKFNADESRELLISEKGIETLTKDFGIKTEIDLRTVEDNENGGITESVLGSGVKYYSMPLVSGGNIILLNKEKLADLFAIFGDEANYPIVFHCSIGTDRTGMLAFLINGLMGVSEEDLYRDFLFSNFGQIGSMRTPSIIKNYLQTINLSNGSSLSEKISNYLINAGVKAEDLATLKRMLSE